MAASGRLMLSLAGGIGADIPVDIGRDDARRAALRELAKPIYQEAKPPLTVRAMAGVMGVAVACLGKT